MVPRPLPLLLLATLVGTACGEVVEPEGFSIATSTTAEVAESGASSVEAPLEPIVGPGATTADFVPSPPEEYVPEILISTSQAVLLAGATEVRALDGPFAGLDTTRAVDDLLGGLVVQRGEAGGQVIWLRSQGQEPEILDGTGAQLLDVGYVEGSPFAVLLVDGDQLEQVRLADAERTPLLTLADGEDVVSLSASGGLHALVIANEQCGALRFYTSDGSEIDLNGPGEPACPVPRRPGYGAVALSPDGGAIAYTEVSYRQDGIEIVTDLIVLELVSGQQLFRGQIGFDGDRITALSFDGERVAYLRRSNDTSEVAVMALVPEEGEERETAIELSGISLVDSVSFARLPVDPETDS